MIYLGFFVGLISCAPLKVTVEEGEGFNLRIAHYTMYENFIRCEVRRLDESVDLSKDDEEFFKLKTGETLFRLFHTTNECGVRVYKANKASAGEWRLAIYMENGTFTVERTEVSVVQKPEPKCPEKSPHFCYLASVNSKEKKWSCNFRDRNMTDMCHFASPGAMEFKSVDLGRRDDRLDHYKGKIFKVEHSHILSCEVPVRSSSESGTFKAHQCRITHLPTGRVLNIEDGLQHQRYSAFKTDLKKNICQLEIPNPIGDDAGTWQMVVKNSEHSLHYCEFQLHDIERLKRDLEEKSSNTEVINMLQNDTTVTIPCAKDLPYAIYRCYFQTNTDIIFSPAQADLDKGTCSMQLYNHELGSTVTCGFNGFHKNDPDFVRKFSIEKHQNELEIQQIHSNVLQCRQVFNEPLKNCLFESPSKGIYSLPTDTFATNSFSFFNEDGQKLKKGYCAIALSNGSKLEEGIWRCIASKGDRTLKREINICRDCKTNLVID